MPSVENFDDVLKLREQGYSFHYDKRNDIFKIYDPRTKKYVGTISRRLTEAVKALLGMRTRKEEKTPPGPGPKREEIEKGLEDDVQFMITTMKQRLDPKLPVMTKFVEDVSWWQHLMFDFSKMAVPEVFALMKADDIDVKNPETTAERMVNKVKELKEVARKVSELESRLKSLAQDSNVILLRSLEELRSIRKNSKSSIVIHNPATMCAACGRIYPIVEESCVCGSSSKSFVT